MTVAKLREQDDQQTAQTDHQPRSGDQQALGPRPVHQQSGRYLADRRGDGRRAHGEADRSRIPVLGALKVDRQIRPDAIPHVGHQEVDSVQPAARSAEDGSSDAGTHHFRPFAIGTPRLIPGLRPGGGRGRRKLAGSAGRWRTEARAGRWRRSGDLRELSSIRADRGGFDHAAERAGEPVALDIQRRARRQFGSQTSRLGRRQPHDGAILQQRTVQVAFRPMKLNLDVSLRSQHLLGASRTAGTARPIVGNGVAGRVVRDRHGLHHRNGSRAQAVNGHRIAGFHREDQLRAEVWRQMHLGPVRQDRVRPHRRAASGCIRPTLPWIAGNWLGS